MRKKTNEEYVEEFNNKNYKGVKLVSKYLSANEKITAVCKQHGKFSKIAQKLLVLGCPQCGHERGYKARRMPVTQFLKTLEEKFKGNIVLKDTYECVGRRMKFKCLKHNIVFNAPGSRIIADNRTGCVECGRESVSKKFLVYTDKISKKLILEKFKGDIELLRGEGSLIPATFKCNFCKNIWKTPIPNQLNSRGCKFCKPLHKGAPLLAMSEYIKRLKNRKIKVTPLEEYKGIKKPILHQCDRCSFKWNINPGSILVKCNCPNCFSLRKKVHFLGERKVIVEGHEPVALDILVKRYKPSDIEVYSSGNVPLIRYVHKEKKKNHRPDIFIEKKNLIIEVKGPETMGIQNHGVFKKSSLALFNILKRKHRAVLEQGFKYKVMLITNEGNLIKLPKNWFDLKHEEIKNWWINHEIRFK